MNPVMGDELFQLRPSSAAAQHALTVPAPRFGYSQAMPGQRRPQFKQTAQSSARHKYLMNPKYYIQRTQMSIQTHDATKIDGRRVWADPTYQLTHARGG